MRLFLMHTMKLLAIMLLFSSCASLSGMGVGRVKRYTIESDRLPASFDRAQIAFISDLHYPSLFTAKRLQKLVRKVRKLSPDVLMMGGDYTACEDSLDALFSPFSSLEIPCGTYAVAGNHDKRRAAAVAASMERAGITLLADSCVLLAKDGGQLCVAGVGNSMKVEEGALAMLSALPDSLFTILLAHAPDFAQDARVAVDLVLSGHTHGGQVSLFRLYTPVKNTKYGTRFLTGLNRTDKGVPVITTNGVGTSRRKLRFCAPSEIVLVRLRKSPQK